MTAATPEPLPQRPAWTRCAAKAALYAVALATLAAGLWLAWTHEARLRREVRTPEQIAEGRGRWIGTSDAELHVQEWGDLRRPTVLLAHGTGAWSGTWFSLPEALRAAGWRVVAVDLPPFGLSRLVPESVRGDYSRQAQAARILQLIDRLGVPVTLVGHSFGAGPALEAAVQAPQGRIRQVVLVDPALGLGPDGAAPRCESDLAASVLLASRDVRTVLIGASATSPLWTATLLKQFVHRKEVVTETLAAAYQVPFARKGYSAALGDWAHAFAAAGCERADSLDPLKLGQWASHAPPVALLWGQEDTITPVAQARALQTWMPNAALSVLPGVGHIPYIEDPAAFAQALLGVMTPRGTQP